MKYKIGDKVRIREDIKICYNKKEGEVCCVLAMLQYAGKEVTIERFAAVGYIMKEIPWSWSDNLLEDIDIWVPEFGEQVKCQSYGGVNSYTYYFIADIGNCYIVTNKEPSFFNGHVLESNNITTWKKEFVRCYL